MHSQLKACKSHVLWQYKLYSLYIEKPALSGHSKRRPEISFQDRLSLNAGQKYCRMLQESILQYFWPSLSYHLSLRPLFCLFLSGSLKQVLLEYDVASVKVIALCIKIVDLNFWNIIEIT